MAQKKAYEVDNFLRNLQKQFPIVLFYGPDRGLIFERAIAFAKLTNVTLDDPFSTLRIEAAELEKDQNRLEDEVKTISLFGGDRLIWIKNANTQKPLIEALKRLINTPLEQCYIIIEAGDLKKGTSLRATIENAKAAMACPCFADDTKALDGLIDRIFEEFNLNISLEARKYLRENLGSDRLISKSELEKLALYAYGKYEITLDDVKNAVSNVSALSSDDIIDAILLGDLHGFNAHFDKQVASNSPLFLILSQAQRQMQQLHTLRYAFEIENLTAHSIVESVKPPIFYRRKDILKHAIPLWPLAEISKAMERLQKTLLESRKNANLAEAIIRQNLLALAIFARRQKQ